ncbi:MAG: hypothetical protein JWQ90_71 [Hydrocarboniphaga sp.]|uniref:hypothetical protein n=1 Tax=Hydrocarboniphaga sp. TaxID=2033016 RepID=UPI00262B6C87|nr:hypothetical protein [Hydrocarboniphaga sp.]MDB5967621.1 hypothetical protein [Hydrocarboniphaga sp.]
MSSEYKSPSEIQADEISRAWATTKSVQPPSQVDEAVLKFARDAQAPVCSRRRWQAPLALAAVLTLGVGVVLQLWREPLVRAPQPQAAPAVLPASAPPVEASVAGAPAAAKGAAADAVAARRAEEPVERRFESESRQRDSAVRKQMQRSAESAHALTAAPPSPPPPPTSPFDTAPQKNTAAFAPQGMAFSSYEPAAPAAAWQPASFQGLALATAAREQVRALYGAPTSIDAQRVERYAQLPGVQGAAEFRYDEQAQLSSLRLFPEPSPTIDQWFETTGRFDEPPQIADSNWSCEARSSTPSNASLWLYPSRGVWLVLDAEKRVLQVNYAAHCEPG